MILTVAYRRGLSCFLACLILPVLSWILLVMNVRTAAVPFAVALVGMVVAGIGGYIIGFE
jgi:hypothetical protein